MSPGRREAGQASWEDLEERQGSVAGDGLPSPLRALPKSSCGWKQAEGPDDVFILFPGPGSIYNSEGRLLRKIESIWNFETLSVNILGLLYSWL